MVSTLVLSSVLLQSIAVNAFPNMAKRMAEGAEKRQAVPQIVPFPEYPGLPGHALFNQFSESQLVSTTGEHAFIAPGPGDIRGPCPGLNAAANHGYLPRDGIATFATLNTGLWEAFGLDQTATQVLQQTTTFFDGDPLSQKWSIGYYSDKVSALGPLSGLLGKPTGICNYGHLKSEGDASITRGDFLAPEDNSNCASYPKFFQELLDLAKERTGGPITSPVLAEHQHNRKLHSIATNPNYFAPAFAGVAFTPAAHHFVFQLMANHSAEYPRGILTPETLMTFFSYERDANGELKYTYGHDRIPDNWYRRSHLDPWTMPDILTAVAQQCAAYPSTCQVGGNTGKVNSFVGVDLGDISGGLMNAQSFTDPAILGCFLSQNIQAEAPSSLENVFGGAQLLLAKSKILTTLVPALAALGTCPNLPAGKSVSQYGAQFPGAKVQNSGPRTGPYA
ncbi:hypothetical protein BCR37DRAFT_384063 [Protomyces lactucae-debilis]|uniref:Heme haloperoxidase family profile domain-containing protein n=1 Tax=Protomyces lactucae-debilis TaxID=2754530 RepID=A0A1Y2EWC7_PROLT|nr:uncharacterized protein BCR37DRAFT_384063 [Protomyces lactucae-debilis]ORY75436.1 hypothetical protein BCR37DRAFT_384063 [Protomyces lactucae-debilis]